jgi:tetratricopeptide (TPR) repeat protein
MKKQFLFLYAILINTSIFSQLTTPADGGNLKATISQKIGLTDVKITYDRPGVKGREGKIFGTDIAYFGFQDQHFGTSKAAPWRAGANECTTFSVSNNVKIEGKTLPAGKYGIFMALGENETTIIFSKNADSWGSFYYNESEDALRVNVKQLKGQLLVEKLKYEFLDETETSAVIAMSWEHWKIPFKVEVDLVNDQLNSFRNELRTEKGFTHNAFMQAARYCLKNNVNLEEGLFWADKAITEQYIGTTNFATLSLKSEFLEKLDRKEEANGLMKKAITLAPMGVLNNYGNTLLKAKKLPEALEAFKLNESKNQNDYIPKLGLIKVLSAMGNYKEALKIAKATSALAIDNEANKLEIAGIIKKLSQGIDVN